MVGQIHAKHHKHKRKITSNNKKNVKETGIYSDKFKKLMDKLLYIAGFVGLAMTIPQVTKIWIGKDATGVSAISWITYFFTGMIMVFYGMVHKEKPIIITYLCWEVIYVFIIVGTLIYG